MNFTLKKVQITYDKNLFTLIIAGIIILFVVNITLANIITFFVGKEVFKVEILEKYSLFTQIALVIFIAPLFETLIFQYLVISAIIFFDFRFKYEVAIFTSALAFALSHNYNMYYILIMFCLGILFAFFYLKGKQKFKAGFFAVFCIHAGMNALSFIEF